MAHSYIGLQSCIFLGRGGGGDCIQRPPKHHETSKLKTIKNILNVCVFKERLHYLGAANFTILSCFCVDAVY